MLFLQPDEARAVYAEIQPVPPVQRQPNQELACVSRLVLDSVGREIWLDLCGIVHGVTGKRHVHKPDDPDEWVYNGPDYIKLPEGDVESLVHELCHWLVATPEQREAPNLALDRVGVREGIALEEAAWTLEAWLFSPYLSEAELGALVSPFALEWVLFGADHPTVNNQAELLAHGLKALRDSALDVPQLRQVLRRWVDWVRQN
jgi:hypothetical protein